MNPNKSNWIPVELDNDIVCDLEDEGYSPILAKLLASKGFTSSGEIEEFLNLSLKKLHNPYLLPNIEPALDRIQRAIENKEKIFVWGDYDVDGITATAVVITTLKFLNANFVFHVPHRTSDGYDIKPASIDKALKVDADLLITVDCGILAFEAANYAKEKGLDLIITDHHTPAANGSVPDCLAVINPKISKDYPFDGLAGVGIAFKIMCALVNNMGHSVKDIMKDLIDYVALGTIADVAPMVDENRILVHHGCKQLNKSNKIGIKSLMKVSRTSSVDSTNIGFTLGPRINAAGRLYDPRLALDLLITNDEQEALELAQKLEHANVERQKIQKEAVEEAINIIEENHNPQKDKCIVLSKTGWPAGIVGLIAGKLAETYYVPALVAHEKLDGFTKGSCRSAQGINILECLKSQDCYYLFKEKKDGTRVLGGHSFAAGFELHSDNIDSLRTNLSSYITDTYQNLSFQSKNIYYNFKINPGEINDGTIEEIKKIAPFGSENELPVFFLKKVNVVSISTVSSGRHLKIMFNTKLSKFNNSSITAMWWNQGDKMESLMDAENLDLLVQLDLSNFSGISSTVFIVDARKSE